MRTVKKAAYSNAVRAQYPDNGQSAYAIEFGEVPFGLACGASLAHLLPIALAMIRGLSHPTLVTFLRPWYELRGDLVRDRGGNVRCGGNSKSPLETGLPIR
ncbi:MAG: hypothetical protein WA477_11270 [Candidatus Sulfotelmatobacter sp.]